MDASRLEVHAVWILVLAYVLSVTYELWRSTAKAGVSRHDTMRGFVVQLGGLYLPAAIVIGLLFAGVTGAAWVGLAFSLLLIVVSTLYYNPVILVERQPALIDWIEDIAFTGLHFVAAALLAYEVLGWTLTAG
jgi:hypothetical protein